MRTSLKLVKTHSYSGKPSGLFLFLFVCLMYFTFQFEIADLSFFLVFTFFSQ